MKKSFVFIFVVMFIACNNSAKKVEPQDSENLSIQQRAELVLSKSAQAFKGVDLENDEEGFSSAVLVLEKELDNAYDSFETDEQKKEFSNALEIAVENMDADPDVKIVCVAHIRVY